MIGVDRMLAEPFLKALPIIERLEEHGFQAYFVGGCVRDFYLERALHDIDIATSAKPEQVMKIFEKVIPVGIEHGTVIVRYSGESYEVTTFRTESGYTDKRHPDSVEFISEIDEDLKRRDFTINALAMDRGGKLLDLFGGREDLKRHFIRTVGDGVERFEEDALRILRALRFSSQLGFSIEADTCEAMRKVKDDVASLAVERMAAEMEKWAGGEYIDFSFNYLKELAINEQLPIFKEHRDLLERFTRPLLPFTSFSSFIAYCHLLKPEATITEWIKAWKSSNKTKNEALSLVEAVQHWRRNGLDAWLVYRLDEKLDKDFQSVVVNLEQKNLINGNELRSLRLRLPIRSKNELALKGEEIVALFPEKKKGRWIHELILRLERAVVESKINNTKIDLKEWIKWNPPVIG